MTHYKFYRIAWLLALFLGVLPALNAQDSIEGKYVLVEPPQTTETPGKIELVDVFWYGCPHCNRFMPILEAYLKKKPSYLELRRMPAIFRKSWEMHARAYYTAQLLGVSEKLHVPIYNAIHKEGNKLNTKESLRAFFAENGVSTDDFDQTFESFAVEALLRNSIKMQTRYGVRGTPTAIINGKYRTSGSLAGSFKEMIRVIDVLAKREYQAGAN